MNFCAALNREPRGLMGGARAAGGRTYAAGRTQMIDP